MFDPEQHLRLELVRLVINIGTPLEKAIEVVTPLSEWILWTVHSQPYNTDDKVSANSP